MADINNRTGRTNRPATTIVGTDIAGPIRQGADTEDRFPLYSEEATYFRGAIYGTAGQGPIIKGGTNARAGTTTLVAGTIVVANTSVTANTLVKAWIQNGVQTNKGSISVTTSAGVGFTVTSSNAGDTSGIGWEMTEVS